MITTGYARCCGATSPLRTLWRMNFRQISRQQSAQQRAHIAFNLRAQRSRQVLVVTADCRSAEGYQIQTSNSRLVPATGASLSTIASSVQS